MQELEHIIDALENPPPRPNAVAMVGSILAAGYAIFSVLRAASTQQGFSLSGGDIIGLVFGCAAIAAQVAAFAAARQHDAHYRRALRYAREMLTDCKEQETESVPRQRIATASPTNSVEDDATDAAETAAPQKGQKGE